MKIVLYIAASIDGYIARVDGKVDWLDKFTGTEEDYGYYDFYENIDALIMGSNTYKEILNFDVDWPYAGKPTYVVSNSSPSSDNEDVILIPNDLEGVMKILEENNHKVVWLVGGGRLVSSTMSMNLIDEIILSIMPTTLGDGIRLFNSSKDFDLDYSLAKCETYKNGVVQIHYVKK
ncbi:MAG: dihydrofolate reductase family protein [Bacteroidetes bacterium]|nr:dihydrofolate reductase family protein [Bacteroidota bacterium]